jgi:DNA-binding transcriptional regulator YhcF (GntR family)
MSIITIKEDSGIPKYRQIITSIENALLDGTIKKGDKLPSINSIRNRFLLSRDTILLAYNELKVRGIVQSIVGKGYYVKSENINIKQKVLLLFDELNAFKEDLYNSFLAKINNNIQVDIFFHHFNSDVFNKILYDNLGSYYYYIIMPANLENTNLIIDNLPEDKVYILDQTHKELSKYPSIYQNFEKDIYDGLFQGLNLLKKYKKIVFIFSENKQPKGMLEGFEKFCAEFSISSEIISNLENRELSKGEVYLIPDDKNLILVIKKMKENKLKIANDIGIISYNETLLKEIVEGGITTISTDFNKMGERLALMITNNEKKHIENPSKFILRSSL